MLFVMGVTLYTSRVVLAELGVTDYGIYNVVGSVITIFTFVSEALGNATHRFIAFSIGKGNKEQTREVYSTCMVVHLLIAVVVAVLIETVGLWFLCGKLNIPVERFTAALYSFHISVGVCLLSIIRIPWKAQAINMTYNICPSITRLLSGRIWIDKAYTKGTRFFVALPKEPYRR